jgi:hypothetical protein
MYTKSSNKKHKSYGKTGLLVGRWVRLRRGWVVFQPLGVRPFFEIPSRHCTTPATATTSPPSPTRLSPSLLWPDDGVLTLNGTHAILQDMSGECVWFA